MTTHMQTSPAPAMPTLKPLATLKCVLSARCGAMTKRSSPRANEVTARLSVRVWKVTVQVTFA